MVPQTQAFALASQRQAAAPASRATPQAPELWLAVHLFDEPARSTLEALAAWADRITPRVNLAASDGLLLEIRGSLKLLGGLEAIEHSVTHKLKTCNLAFRVGVAPTPLGALWLAREAAQHVTELTLLPARLGALPVRCTHWPEPILSLLRDMGLTHLDACLRLPRDGFARRVGLTYLHELDRALGRRPDPRATFHASPELVVRIELMSESDDLAVLALAAERLAEQMSQHLRRHQLRAQTFELVLEHHERSPTRETLGLIEPVQHKPRLLEPLLARLERCALPAPVLAVELEALALEASTAGTRSLFAHGLGSQRCREAEAELVERLRGRFGRRGVHGLALVAEHRPEQVWQQPTDDLLESRVGGGVPVSPWAHERPLWLLSDPAPLPEGLGLLRYRGDVRIEPDPERIESGWWDGDDIRRDYHLATTDRGERLWIYRDCCSGEWYLHGIFG